MKPTLRPGIPDDIASVVRRRYAKELAIRMTRKQVRRLRVRPR